MWVVISLGLICIFALQQNINRTEQYMRKMMIGLLIIVVLIAIATWIVLSQKKFGRLPQGTRLARVHASPNYKNGAFQNLQKTPVMTGNDNFFVTLYKFIFDKADGVTPSAPIPTVKTDLSQLPADSDWMVWFGHSSYLLQRDGAKFLIDPVFSGHASPFAFMVNAFDGADTYKAEDMPDIDFLVITHDHWDHLDYKTVMKLKSKIKKIICPLGVGEHFEYWGFSNDLLVELDWNQSAALNDSVKVTATPSRHFSGRGLKRNQSLWASFVLQSANSKTFIGGDGGYGHYLKEIGNTYGPFNLAIIEQGQYDERWKHIHLLPYLLPQAMSDLKVETTIPVHNSKFALANHPWQEPLESAYEHAQKEHLHIITPMIGEAVMLNDSTQTYSRWWE